MIPIGYQLLVWPIVCQAFGSFWASQGEAPSAVLQLVVVPGRDPVPDRRGPSAGDRMTAEMVARVMGFGDYCAGCGDPLEPGELVVWTRDGGTHEACLDDDTEAPEDGTA